MMGNTTATAPREPAYIERAIVALAERVEQVAGLVDKLEAGISPALLDPLPQPAQPDQTGGVRPPVPGSHLAVVISGQVELLDRVIDRLDSICKRIDI